MQNTPKDQGEGSSDEDPGPRTKNDADGDPLSLVGRTGLYKAFLSCGKAFSTNLSRKGGPLEEERGAITGKQIEQFSPPGGLGNS